ALNLVNGTIQAGIAVTVANSVNLFNAGGPGGTVTLGGNTPLTFSGAVSLGGSNTLTLSNPAGTTFAGTLGGFGTLTLVGGAANGTLVLAGDNTSYNGFGTGITLQSGNLVLGSDNALGGASSTATLSGGTVLANTVVTVAAPVTINGPVTF